MTISAEFWYEVPHLWNPVVKITHTGNYFTSDASASVERSSQFLEFNHGVHIFVDTSFMHEGEVWTMAPKPNSQSWLQDSIENTLLLRTQDGDYYSGSYVAQTVFTAVYTE